MRDACEDGNNECASSSAEEEGGHAGLLWQGVWDEDATAVVLECAFCWLAARELWACGRVCRAWRSAASAPALWRRLLLPAAAPPALRALSALTAADSRSDWTWRKEYALENARWHICEQLLPSGASSVSLLCAALHNCGTYLAIVDDDARLTVYEQQRLKADKREKESEWAVQWSDVVKTEWRSISFAQWAPSATSLLLGGRLALVDRFELLCINFDEEWQSKVVCRSGSGAGGAGCWVDDCNFLSMCLQLLAPGHACTTVWLNAASQETYSEFAGVTAPLLRIYNESATHISHILVAEVPKNEDFNGNNAELSTDDISGTPGASYYITLQGHNLRKGDTQRVLVGACGVAEGARGQAQALRAWRLPELQVPVLWVEDHLAQRVQRHRLRFDAGPDTEPDHEPDAELMRALCTPSNASCNLSEQILGIVLHPRGGCVWATTTSGAACVSLPQLVPLLRLQRGDHCERPLSPHYVFPAVDDDYFVTPAGGGAGLVHLWAARSARAGARLQHGAPALAAFLLPRRARRRRLLVLTADNLYAQRTRACKLTHTGMASCRALRVCPRYVYVVHPRNSKSGARHNVESIANGIKDKPFIHSLKKIQNTSAVWQRHANIRSYCYDVLQARMYSKCGAASSTNIHKEHSNVNKLASILSEMSQYSEAARGRVATTRSDTDKQQHLGGGSLDLQVPPSAETVRVRVLLNFKANKMKACNTSDSVKDESNLLMKDLNKKGPTCGKGNSPKPESQQPVDKSKPNPCAAKPRQESAARPPSSDCPPCRPKTKFTLIPTFPVVY